MPATTATGAGTSATGATAGIPSSPGSSAANSIGGMPATTATGAGTSATGATAGIPSSPGSSAANSIGGMPATTATGATAGATSPTGTALKTGQTSFDGAVSKGARTCGGTIGGLPCLFPFDFNGTVYNSCVPVENGGLPWCATSYYKESREAADWGNCDC